MIQSFLKENKPIDLISIESTYKVTSRLRVLLTIEKHINIQITGPGSISSITLNNKNELYKFIEELKTIMERMD